MMGAACYRNALAFSPLIKLNRILLLNPFHCTALYRLTLAASLAYLFANPLKLFRARPVNQEIWHCAA